MYLWGVGEEAHKGLRYKAERKEAGG